ncbi:MAG TPA: VCBS repeat-containing protein, partial [Gemmataceae bacterium]|nr:VCBS repeat-containing protein [Gemmataceae bacterium]
MFRKWIVVPIAATAVAVSAYFFLKGDSAPPPINAHDHPWFEDVTESVGIKFTHVPGASRNYHFPQIMGSGAALIDIDNDGRLDIYLIQNGGAGSTAKNQLFRQKENGQFEDISARSGLDIAGEGMGVAVGDVNNDGWPDIVVTEFRGIRLFLNNGNCTFREVTKEAGLENLQWGMSASFIDFDRDGWLDLVVVNYVDYSPGTPCKGTSGRPDFCHPGSFDGTAAKLYRNLGLKEGRVSFQDVTIRSGMGRRPSSGLGVLCADFNGDGWPDIFVANDGKPNHLWINQKNGTFHDEALLRGCALNMAGQAEANMGVAYADVDGDGLLDLIATHLSEETNTYWKQGPVGFFTDQTVPVGLASARWRGTSFGIALADFDQDGFVDLAVVNGRVSRAAGAKATTLFFWEDYEEKNQLFANDGAGKLRDISESNPAFTARPRIGRGLCVGDICGTGRCDLLATYVNGPARLYKNNASGAGHWLT